MTRRGVAAVLFTIVGLASPAVAQTTPRAPGRTDAGTARGGAAFERLRNNIEQIARSVDTHWGIYIKCLDTSEEIAINADEAMDTMSVIKLPLMVEAFRQIEAGQFALTDKYTLKAGDRRPGTAAAAAGRQFGVPWIARDAEHAVVGHALPAKLGRVGLAESDGARCV